MPEAIKTQEFLESILSLAASSGASEKDISATDFGIKNRLEGCVSEYVYHLVLKPFKINNFDFDLSNSDFSGLELDSVHSKPATTTTRACHHLSQITEATRWMAPKKLQAVLS